MLVTKDKQDILIIFKDETLNISQFTIKWSMDPPASTDGKFQVSTNGNVLTLRRGALVPLTTYTLKVDVAIILYPQIKYSLTQAFTTKTPPFGGKITIDPLYMANDSNKTAFTLTFSGWQSMALPIQYRVSQSVM